MPTDELLRGHRRFREGEFAAESNVFARLAEEGQSPEVLWIGCSDSRVIPEKITCARAGDLFIMRNVANIVPPPGAGGDASGAVIEYAVCHLRVSHIVICGHTQCGGIAALEEPIDPRREAHLTRWLEWARPARARADAAGVAAEMRYLETIRANVLLQQENLLMHGCVTEGVETGSLATHAWLYDIRTGQLSAHDPDANEWKVLPPPSGR